LLAETDCPNGVVIVGKTVAETLNSRGVGNGIGVAEMVEAGEEPVHVDARRYAALRFAATSSRSSMNSSIVRRSPAVNASVGRLVSRDRCSVSA
jgi:hypothetical protein